MGRLWAVNWRKTLIRDPNVITSLPAFVLVPNKSREMCASRGLPFPSHFFFNKLLVSLLFFFFYPWPELCIRKGHTASCPEASCWLKPDGIQRGLPLTSYTAKLETRLRTVISWGSWDTANLTGLVSKNINTRFPALIYPSRPTYFHYSTVNL